MTAKTTVAAIAAGAFALGLSANAALAQDASAERWSGLYGGVVAGYSEGRANVKDAPLATRAGGFFGPAGTRFNSDADFKLKGGEYGVTAGWNHQDGHLVAGFEGDVSYSDVDGHRSYAGSPINGVNTNLAGDLKYLATLRARLGYAAGPLLLYGTTGFAATQLKFKRGYSNAAGTVMPGDDTRGYTGFTYGAGAEYALGSKWSMKAEYLRLNLGDHLFRNGYTDGSSAVSKVRLDRDVYRVGLNYRF